MLGTVFSITGVLLCIISAALGIYTAKLDKLHLQLIENGTKVNFHTSDGFAFFILSIL